MGNRLRRTNIDKDANTNTDADDRDAHSNAQPFKKLLTRWRRSAWRTLVAAVAYAVVVIAVAVDQSV